jgi:hypothetical protein
MKTQTFLLAVLVVLVAVGLWMYHTQQRQQAQAARYAAIQAAIAAHHMRIASLCADGMQATYENATAESLNFSIKTFNDVKPSGDIALPLWRNHMGCLLEYRALIDDKVREEKLRKEYEQ